MIEENDPPGLAWMIGRLAEFGGPPKLIRHHAERCRYAVIAIKGRNDRVGYALEDGKRIRVKTRGPSRELEELRRAAMRSIRRQSNAPWITGWAAATARTRALVWKPTVPADITDRGEVTKGLISFQGPGFHMLAPPPDKALLLIAAAISEHRDEPADKRQARLPDDLADELAIELRKAFVALTGEKAPKGVLRGGKQLDSQLLKLLRDVDQYFDLKVFRAADSKRLRRVGK